MDEIIKYIIEFLLYGNKEAAKQVGYTGDPTEWSRYKVCIQPNGHLGKDWVMPDLSRPILEQDLIYNTAFFISQAEETLTPQRDVHGRFLAKHSLLGQGNRLMIPLLDEYSRVLMKALDLPLPAIGFSTINLTHDIDFLDYYRHLRGALGGIIRGHFKEVMAARRDIHNDPAYTFDWLIKQDEQVKQRHPETQVIYFVKHTKGRGFDYPQYNLQGKDYRQLEQTLLAQGAQIGWHSSYYPTPLLPSSPTPHRSHYLHCDIHRLQQLVEAGVTHDYSMGFADKAGFRLQTTRPVRWINPLTFELTNLTLHPLTIMDCTLSNECYMNLSEEEAFYYCQQLIEKVKQYHGELTLLWHNHIMQDPYHHTLYPELLSLIIGPSFPSNPL